MLACFNSEIAAMLFFSCSSAVSTPAVTCSAFCTMRLWLIRAVKSRRSSLPAPLEWYSSYLLLSELVCSAWDLSPYRSCCQVVSQGCSFHSSTSTTNKATSNLLQPRSFGAVVGTYRSASEEDLRRLPAPHALEELVDNVLGHVHLHGLDWRRFGVPGPDVAIRSPKQGNAARGKQRGRHG